MRRLRHRHDERGFALVIALGTMTVLSIVLITVIDYTASNVRGAGSSKSSQVAYSLAEAGMGYALSVLNNAQDPMTGSLLTPPTTVTLEGGTATYKGNLNPSTAVWTITSTGAAKNPAGAAALTRSLTRQVQVYGINAGATTGAWSRIYSDTTGCTTVSGVNIPSPFTAKGDLCLVSGGKLTGSTVTVGGLVEMDSDTSIGLLGTPIQRADIAGTCKWGPQTAHTPCSSVDHVYATTITTSPQDLTKPTVDFAYWYQNAKPGPSQNCTTGSFPGGFDTNGTYDNSLGAPELTPTGSSYTCQVRDGGGNLIGELSWSNGTHILTIKGTIFIDGPIKTGDPDQLVNYQGKGTIYAAGQWLNWEVICAGGTANCRTGGTMASWDPTANMLVIIAGDKETLTLDHIRMRGNAAFQGVGWASKDCRLEDFAYTSAPLICNNLRIGTTTVAFFTWPPLGSLQTGQIYGSTSTSIDFQLVNGNQSG